MVDHGDARMSRRSVLVGGAALGSGLVVGGAAGVRFAPADPATARLDGIAGFAVPGPVPVPDPGLAGEAARRQEFRALVRCGLRTVHVSGSGSDSGSGSADAPLRQISRAVATARPGDLVLVHTGEYSAVEITDRRGRPDAWLGVMTARPDTRAVITVPAGTRKSLDVVGSTHVGVYGLELAGQQRNPDTNGSGISVYGNSHHVAVWKCFVHDFPGGGVNCFDSGGSHDAVDIRYNHITRTSRYSPSNTSGISIYAARDLTGGSAGFPDGYSYRIVGNYLHDVVCTVPFTPGGVDFVTDGNGISLDSNLTAHGYRKAMLVANNVVTGCGGRGIYSYRTADVDIAHNTVAGNLRWSSPALDGQPEVMGTTDATVRCVANVIVPLHTDRTTDQTSTWAGNLIAGGTQPVPPGNIDRRGRGLSVFRAPISPGDLVEGTPLPGLRLAR